MVSGLVLFFLGKLISARDHLEHVITFYDLQQHHALAFYYGQDPGVICLSVISLVLWLLGYPDKAFKTIITTLELAEELSHAYSTAYVLIFLSLIHLLVDKGSLQ